MKARKASICLDESILGKVVAQLAISQRLPQEEPTYRRLIFPNQLVEGLSVMKYSHLRNEREIVQLFHLIIYKPIN